MRCTVNQVGHALGIVAEVGVHGADVLVAVLQSELEAGLVGSAQPQLARAMEDMDAFIAGGDGVGDVAGAVGRVVVDNRHVHIAGQRAQLPDETGQIFTFVVGRHDHQRRSRPGWGHHCVLDRLSQMRK